MPLEERGRKRFPTRPLLPDTTSSSSSSSLSTLPSPPYSSETGIQGRSFPQFQVQRGQASSPRTKSPIHIPSSKDITRKISVWSKKEGKLKVVTATFVTDLTESWISEEFTNCLGLSPLANSTDNVEYGHLGPTRKTVIISGTAELVWSLKGCFKSEITRCRIVRDKSFTTLLDYSLLPAPPPILQHARAEDAPSSPPNELQKSPQQPLIFQHGIHIPGKVGSFDGLPKVIDEDSEESMAANDYIYKLETFIHKHIEKPPGSFQDMVKIAVLDTGLDSRHGFIKGAIATKQIKTVRSFIENDESTEDTCGHGTHVATLLLKTAPNAQLYVAKVAQTETIPLDHNIAEAIRWAVNHKVDIITMSFGLEEKNVDMQKAILAAYADDIILFAAASNGGGNNAVTYPARAPEVICVYATDGGGTPFKDNPTEMEDSKYHFAALGVAVKSATCLREDPATDPAPELRRTGTSFATPIAAGIAACVLDFALMNDMADYKSLRSREGIHSVFAKHLVDYRSGLHYIHPWKLFTPEREATEILTLIKSVLKR